MELRNWFNFWWELKCSRGKVFIELRNRFHFLWDLKCSRGKVFKKLVKKLVPFFVGPQVFFANYLA